MEREAVEGATSGRVRALTIRGSHVFTMSGQEYRLMLSIDGVMWMV